MSWSSIARGPTQDVTYLPVDLTDYGQVLDAMLGVEERYARVDALVHLAAIPAPGRVPDHATFANNMNATWNVVSAARRAGITNIVWASSETVLGLPFDTPPPYVPVDEEYPPRPESTYSLVKTLEETMAAQLCRWDPELKMIGLRFSNVMRAGGLRGLPELPGRRRQAEVEPLGLHRRPRRRPGGPARSGVRPDRL